MSLLANCNESIKSITHADAVAGYDQGKWDASGVIKATGETSLVIAAALADGAAESDIDGLRYDVSRAIEGQVDVYDATGMRGRVDRDGYFSACD
jgi:hypothetical protein